MAVHWERAHLYLPSVPQMLHSRGCLPRPDTSVLSFGAASASECLSSETVGVVSVRVGTLSSLSLCAGLIVRLLNGEAMLSRGEVSS